MREEKKRLELQQAMAKFWKEQVREQEAQEQVERALQTLRRRRLLVKASPEGENRIRRRLRASLDKLRRRKAAEAEKRRRKEEGLAKFSKGLGFIFAFNIFLTIAGLLVIYWLVIPD